MKIYFAASIRGGMKDKEIYHKIIAHLQTFGQVLSEILADPGLTSYGSTGAPDGAFRNRDLAWLKQSDFVVAEVSTPSLGVGYELARAEAWGKKVLCLHRNQEGKRLSAMISGCESFLVKEYATLDEAFKHIDVFFKEQ